MTPQLIETAPKDGRRILVYGVSLLIGSEPQCDDKREWNFAYWSDPYEWRGEVDDWIRSVTHWMPEPDAPRG